MTASLQEKIDVQNAELAPAPIALALKEINGRGAEWNLALHPAHLALADSPGAQPYVIMREQVMKTAILVEGVLAFAVTRPIKATFKLTAESVAVLAEWIGKPVLARYCLTRRYSLVLPAAIIWMITSLPIKGGGGIESVPFDPFGLVLGGMLAVAWALAKWRPHPALFLVDSFWFLAMAGHVVWSVMNGRSKGWLALLVFFLFMVVTGVKSFVRFRGIRIPQA